MNRVLSLGIGPALLAGCVHVASDAPAPPSTVTEGGVESGARSPAIPDAGGSADELPPLAALTADELKRTWVRIAAPHANSDALVSRTPNGFVAMVNETTPTGDKDVGPSWNYVYESTDGVTWARMPSLEQPFGQWYWPFVYGAGRYVTGYGGGCSCGHVYTSMDLLEWARVPFPGDADGGGGPDFGRMARIGQTFFGLGHSNIWRSPDGLNWSSSFVSLIQARAIAYGNGVYVAAGALSIHQSTDGATWVDRSPSCGTAGAAACVLPPEGGSTVGGPYDNAVFIDGRFYVDHLTSTDGVTWAAHDAPVANETVGGYLFNYTGDGTTGTTDVLRAWLPGEAVQTLAVEASPTPAALVGGVGPATVSTPLSGGETCGDHRCVVLNHTLYLLR